MATGFSTVSKKVRDAVPKVMRVAVFLFVLALAATAFSLHRAHAQLSETLLDLGVDMLRYEGAERQQDPRTMVINGQPIHLATGHARHGLTEVLDYFESRCQEHDGGLTEQLEAALASGTPFETDTSLLDGVLRRDESQHGFVACFDTGTAELGPTDMAKRVESFTRSMDLSDIGDFRYIYAQHRDGVTMFITVWMQGSVDIGAMFPSEGDAPGSDLVDVPRPLRSRRIFSTLEMGHDKVIVMYEGDTPKGTVESFYKREMPELGWQQHELTQEEADTLPFEAPLTTDEFMVFERGGRMVAVTINNDTNHDPKVVTAVLEL